MAKLILAAGLAAAVAVAVALTGIAANWGAHPFWAGTVPLIGLIVAAPVFAIAVRWPWAGLLAALLLAVGGGLAARLGKAEFAASYAENALAGQFWYFGWIALAAGATVLIAIVILKILPRTVSA